MVESTFFLQRTTVFILFLIVPSLQISCFGKTREKQYAKYDLKKRIAARLIWQLVIHSCVIFAYIISRRDGENNGFLAGVSLPPPFSRARRVSLAPETLFPFPFKRLPRSLFLTQKRQKCPGGTSRKIGWGCAARFLKPLPYFRPKSLIFPTLFQTWSPGARRVTEARDKLLRHVHGSWRKH